MLLFRSEENVNAWCEARNLPRRPLVSLEQLWQLSLAWYESRMTIESRRPDASEMVGIFASVGLSGDFWNPKSDEWDKKS